MAILFRVSVLKLERASLFEKLLVRLVNYSYICPLQTGGKYPSEPDGFQMFKIIVKSLKFNEFEIDSDNKIN